MDQLRKAPIRASLLSQCGLLRRLACLASLSALLLAGCTTLSEYVHNGFKVGPNYKRPAADVADKWIDTTDPRVHSTPPDDCHWWTTFQDPVLDDLVQHAYQQNLPLREAAFRILQYRAQLGIALGNLFPQTQSLSGGYTRKGISATVANHQFTPERWFNIYDGGLNLSWEIDFWGRYRRSIEAARDTFDAQIEDYDGILVLLVSDVARGYAQVRTLQMQLAYTRANVEVQRKTLELVTDRFNGGAVSNLDVTQATTNLERTEAQIPPLEIGIRQACNALCVLLGMPPEDLEKKLGAGKIPSAPPDVAVGIPADLLRRRPDVRRAERYLAAQCANIGVAEAQLYPALVINGQIGYSTSTFKDWFNDQSIVGAVGPQIQWNVLNYGRLLNNVRAQDAHFQELAAQYQQTVLTANEDVENGLVAFLKSQQQVKAQAKAVAAAQESVNIVLIQYKDGKVDFNRVYLLERDLIQEQILLAQATGNVAFGLIDVYKALGGGWQIRCCAPNQVVEAPAAPPVLMPVPQPPMKVEEQK
jgi:NodT family efflux transporter outer membrane factor (OMF) lipoprotein